MQGLSNRLRELERELNLARGWQADLARACGVKPPSVNGWYTGSTKTIDAAHIFKAAAFFKVHARWLALGVGPKWSNEPMPAEPPKPPTLDECLRQIAHACLPLPEKTRSRIAKQVAMVIEDPEGQTEHQVPSIVDRLLGEVENFTLNSVHK